MNISENGVPKMSTVAMEAWEKRKRSFDAFNQFNASFAKDFFDKLLELKPNTLEGWYIAWHSLCICPRGADGGMDHSRFEVFFGLRPHPVLPSKNFNAATQNDHTIERGAMLRYSIQVDGSVTVQLFPAQTEEIRQLYDWILLKSFPSAEHLLKRRMLQRHWRALMSCMASTSLSGAFRRQDRWRMTWLRLWCYRYENDRLQYPPGPAYLSKSLLQVVSWFFGVALSGAAVTWYLIGHDTVTPAVRDSTSIMQGGLQKLHGDLGDVRAEIKELSSRIAEDIRMRSKYGNESVARPDAKSKHGHNET